MSRTQRKLSKETKKKISNSLKGKSKSSEQKRKISESMKKYWESIPYENNDLNTEGNGQQKIN